MIRLMEWVEMKTLHDSFYEDVSRFIEKTGQEFDPCLIIIGEKEKDGRYQAHQMSKRFVKKFFESDSSKDMMMWFIEGLLTEDHEMRRVSKPHIEFDPIAVVQINEAWSVTIKEKPEGKIPRPSVHPNREEVLLIIIHTPGLSIPTFHKIHTTPFRHLHRGEFPRKGTFSGGLALQDRGTL